MAASSWTKGGFTCEFVGEEPEDFLCLLCLNVARDPHIISCCGEHFCESCILPLLENKQPCPNCCAQEFTTLLNVKLQQKIISSEVFCVFRDRGCSWTGELNRLESHVDVEAGDCKCIDVDCPKECGKKVQRKAVKLHLEQECLKRLHTCPYCSFKDIYEVVSSKHMDQCPYFPIRCPNYCGVTCERMTMDIHMSICPLEKILCKFSFAGCKEECLRDDMDTHMKQNVELHLAMLSEECLSMRKDFEAQLRERDQAMKEMQTSFTRQLHAKQREIQQLNNKLEQLEDTQREDFEMQTKFHYYLFPFCFTITDFGKKAKELSLFSNAFKTHPKGYKLMLVVSPNGVGEGAGTHISLSISPQMSLHDSTLKWPVRCAITVQLMNQFHDQDHLTATEVVSWRMPTTKNTLISYSRLFVRHDELEWNPKKRTLFLYEDIIQFTITKITIL